MEFEVAPPSKFANETAFYVLDDFKITNKFSLNVGLRGTIFSQVGPYTSKLDGQEYDRFKSVKTYIYLAVLALAEYLSHYKPIRPLLRNVK